MLESKTDFKLGRGQGWEHKGSESDFMGLGERQGREHKDPALTVTMVKAAEERNWEKFIRFFKIRFYNKPKKF